MSLDAEEREFWNQWNAEHREEAQGFVSLRQAEIVEGWLAGESGLRILDIGCGTGWMTERLLPYGEVTGTDLADEVVGRARLRTPEATFVAGDFMTVDVGSDFDVIVCFEALSYVADQPAFLARFASYSRLTADSFSQLRTARLCSVGTGSRRPVALHFIVGSIVTNSAI